MNNRGGGCWVLVIIVIIALIGVALRSQGLVQFGVMAGETLGVVFFLFAGFAALGSQGCWSKLQALWAGFMGLALLVSVGNFLITGNYEQSVNLLQAQFNPKPTAVTQSGASPTSTPQPALTPTSTSTPTPQPTLAATLTSVAVSQATSPGSHDWSWISEAESPPERITTELNEIWKLPAQAATEEADRLRAVRQAASAEGRLAAGLLLAVALERGGNLNSARQAYADVADMTKGTSYAVSAAFRLRSLENRERSVAERETLYTTIAAEPEAQGWFVFSDSWLWNTNRRAAWQALVDLRADQLSIRFLEFLRSMSPFPPPYAYLFILLALTLGARILALPLSMQSAKTAIQLGRLQPVMQQIRILYDGDPVTMNQALMDLYKRSGVNLWGGCLVSIVDLIFVIWALVGLSSFSPQFALDGAKLWWIADVTTHDVGITIVWLALNIVQIWLSGAHQQAGQTGAQLAFGSLVFGAIIVGIAWYWKWPAYVFVFWALLSVCGMLVMGVLRGIAAATE